jgi:ribosomal protein L11 methyltransferase
MIESTVELSVHTEGGVVDELVALLGGLGFEGFWEDGNNIRAYMSLQKWTDSNLISTREMLDAYATAKGILKPRIDILTIPPQNWNAQWEESIQPVRVSPRIVIAPSWRHLAPEPGVLVLTIDPKMSFGTGHHETTRLILLMMEQRITKECTMLDVGTGTGLLAIASVKLGAKQAVGVDIDEWSWENARENAQINGVEELVEFHKGESADIPDGRFDIVAANIQRSVIEPLLPALCSRTSPDGWLFLSGILISEAAIMRRALENAGLHLVEERTENEWIAFALRHAH